MSGDKIDGGDNLKLYLKSALHTNLFFLRVRVALNITFSVLMFLSSSYLLHKLIFDLQNLDTTIFIKEFIFLFITPWIFRTLSTSSYNKSRFDYYENLTQKSNEQK